jgi:uncharacterized protein (TIGR02147 family)
MITEAPFYKLYLEQELARRCEKNANYSLRAFAKALGVDAGNLSRFMSGKAFLSGKAVEKLVDGLALTPEEKTLFAESFIDEQKRRKLDGGRSYVNRVTPRPSSPNLEIELFRIISDWYHCAILELTFTKNFKSDARWIAKQLGITPLEAKLAVDRLIKLELLEQKNGRLQKTKGHITTKDKHLTTPALKKLQKQLLEKAIFSLENVPIEERNQSAMTMAIDPKKLPLAKRMIEEFTNTLCQVLESGERKQVYQFSASLYPLQMKEKL